MRQKGTWQVKDKTQIKPGQNPEKTLSKPGQNLKKPGHNSDKTQTKLREIQIFGSNFF